MTKFDWSKAKTYQADPARVQRVHDFVEPDSTIISVRDLTPSEKKRIARKQSRRGKARAKLKALLKRKPKRKVKAKPEPKKVTDEGKKLAAEARRVGQAEHQQRYLAKTHQQLATAKAKKKSHLEAWVEKQTVVQTDRATLNQEWRAKLLGRPKEE